jgi:microcin C transport system substrate-binding protein
MPVTRPRKPCRVATSFIRASCGRYREHSVRCTRRGFLPIAGAALLAPSLTGLEAHAKRSAGVRTQNWRHGLSLFGDLKYPAGFAHFDYVNPHAPKGGTVRQGAFGTYDNFNMVVAGWKGRLAAGVELIHDTLLTPSLDEPSAEYGLLAEAITYPADISFVTYRLRAEARWHDGQPVTPDDVIFSFTAFKNNNPQLSAYYRHVRKAEVTGEREVTFTFDSPGNRELPQIVGQLTILPKHWWDDKNHNRDVAATTLEPPLGSGAYRIKEFEAGRTLVYERVENYWGKNLNVRIGRDNLAELRFDYYRDWTVEFEGFKADQFDWFDEHSAKNWATGYQFPAVEDKRVVLEEFPIRNVGVMQAFAFNIRRRKFKAPQLRHALNFAFDFERMNKEIFYGQYKRIASYFEGTELASSGIPQGRELQMLEAVRYDVPPEVFTTPYSNPVGGSPDAVRHNFREAKHLLETAGFSVRDFKLVDAATGEPFTIEFLLGNPGYERVVLFYKQSLARLGIDATVRIVDDVQYANRLRQWDFDAVIESWTETLSPGNELRDYWGSQAAVTPGSRNVIGIANKAVDALIQRVVFAKNREELVAATRALDRVLLWNDYVVPQWTYGKVRTARWDRFGKPDRMPVYGLSAFPAIWWWDSRRATETASRS